jgi:transcriptional regulator of met regulon
MQQSLRLANFAALLTDHGPIRQIKSMREVNGSELLSPDALPMHAISKQKVTLEMGDISENSNENDEE